MTLPAAQTYTDGSVVKRDEKTVEGQAEPEHPAPPFVTMAKDAAATAVTAGSPAPATTAAGWFGLVAA